MFYVDWEKLKEKNVTISMNKRLIYCSVCFYLMLPWLSETDPMVWMLQKQMDKCCSQIQILNTHTTPYSWETVVDFRSALGANSLETINLDDWKVSELTLLFQEKYNPIWLHS